MSSASMASPSGSEQRVLPEQGLLGDLRAEVQGLRAHVTVGQLGTRRGRGVRELLRVLVEPAGDRLVDRVVAQRRVGGEHLRAVLLRRVVRVGDDLRGVLATHWLAPAGLCSSSYSYSKRFLRKPLLHRVGVVVRVTSRPGGDGVPALARAVGALPRPISSTGGEPRGRRRRRLAETGADGVCEECVRRRSARRSPRRSSPCGGTSHGCRGRRRSGPGCRSSSPG